MSWLFRTPQWKLLTIALVMCVSPASDISASHSLFDLKAMMSESDVVVHGTVIESHAYRKEIRIQTNSGVSKGEQTLSDFEVSVDEILNGEGIGSEITLTSFCGIIGSKGCWDSNAFYPGVGLSIVAFAKHDEENDIWIIRWVFQVVEHKDVKYLINLISAPMTRRDETKGPLDYIREDRTIGILREAILKLN